jgi:hypothetical protein
MMKSRFALALVATVAVSSVPSISFARNDYDATVCTPDKTVMVPVATQQCSMVPQQVETGRTICTVVNRYQKKSADFVGNNSCLPEMTTVMVQQCQTVFVNTPQVVPGNCPPATDECASQGHNCNHGGGPGG